jgi:prepilin-type N-terminal cleavage/methylation domain-containing protein
MNKFFKQQLKSNQAGFTLIELMLAMTLFTSVMIVATVGFVGINRTFSKGLVRKNLSEGVARLVSDVSSTIQNEGKLTDVSSTLICGTTTCYDSSSGGLIRGIKQPDGKLSKSNQSEILDSRYKVENLQVKSVGYTGDLYRITGVARTKDDESFEKDKDTGELICRGSAKGGARDNCALQRINFVVRVKKI